MSDHKQDLERSLRSAFGCFATGVCVVTTGDPAGGYAGVTINSFSSVSLDPPLLSWCLDRSARRYGLMSQMDQFIVNVLSDEQKELALQAATAPQFNAETWPGQAHPHGWVFEGALAAFFCRVWQTVEAGDHIIFIGEIERHEVMAPAAPLLYHKGKFAQLAGN